MKPVFERSLRQVFGVFSLLLAIGLSLRLSDADAAESAARAATGNLLDEVREIVRANFYDKARVDAFDGANAKPAAAKDGAGQAIVPGTTEPSRRIAEGLKALRASHTQRYTKDQLDYYELLDIYAAVGLGERLKALFPPEGTVTYAGIGMVPRTIDGRTYVAYVYDGSPAQRAGVLLGDEVVTVDGKPLHPVASFAGRAGHSVKLQLRRKRGAAPFVLSVPVVAIHPSTMLVDAIKSSVRVLETPRGRYGYMRLWTYASDEVRGLVSTLLSTPPLRGSDGLVLDLRSRWGGAPPDAAEVFVGGTPNLELVGRDGKAFSANVRWRAPVVAIIDQGTRSGMEIMAYALKGAGRTLVGTGTAGAVLGGRPYLLKDDSLMLLAVMDVRVAGARLEGIGVRPDIEVPFDIRYAAGRDPQLDRAVAELERQRR
jgi:C-terminal processing protease CtpA/Prc